MNIIGIQKEKNYSDSNLRQSVDEKENKMASVFCILDVDLTMR